MTWIVPRREQGSYATILEACAQRPIITVMFVSASVFPEEYCTRWTALIAPYVD
jgi:hypothetical protein